MTHNLISIVLHRIICLLVQLRRHVALVMKVGGPIASTILALTSHSATICVTSNSLSF
jgi:hypothetical protein